MNKQKLLITGVSGFLGSSLAYALKDRFDILGIYHAHAFSLSGIRTCPADLASPEDCQRIVKEFKPDICIHCAALADIDRCETNREEAYRANVEVARFLTDALLGARCKLVYISTDAVYGGDEGNYSEDITPKPLNYYATTKLLAESEAVRCPGALIVRTAFFGWNRGPGKLSLTEWALKELSAGHKIRGFTDVITSSLYTMDFERLLTEALHKDLTGIFNFASADSMSKYELVRSLARQFGFDEGLVEPASIEQFPLKARRSRNLSLSSVKLSQALGLNLPTLEEGLERLYKDRESVKVS
jgi:dTDP-4-dehydrorhamnose reductase